MRRGCIHCECTNTLTQQHCCCCCCFVFFVFFVFLLSRESIRPVDQEKVSRDSSQASPDTLSHIAVMSALCATKLVWLAYCHSRALLELPSRVAFLLLLTKADHQQSLRSLKCVCRKLPALLLMISLHHCESHSAASICSMPPFSLTQAERISGGQISQGDRCNSVTGLDSLALICASQRRLDAGECRSSEAHSRQTAADFCGRQTLQLL